MFCYSWIQINSPSASQIFLGGFFKSNLPGLLLKFAEQGKLSNSNHNVSISNENIPLESMSTNKYIMEGGERKISQKNSRQS